jgi:large subunit ribosomal protein L3
MSEQATATAEKPASSSPAIKAILGQKIGMTQIYDAHGTAIPVTVVQAGPCPITQVMTKEKHGYTAVQVSFGDVRVKSVNKPEAGRFKKINQAAARWTREFRLENAGDFQVGQQISCDVFVPGEYVDVVGVSKGKGFAGVMKRHNFRGGPSTHGQSDRQRAPGSIGSNTFPGHVFKGQRMAGHLGNVRTTVQSVMIVEVMPEQNVLLIRGAIPGAKQSLVEIRQTIKRVKLHVEHHEVHKEKKAAKKEAPKAAAAKPAAKPAAK